MMNQEDIFKKIGQIINELTEQYQYLAQNPAELNELELELFLANSNFLSDHVQIIRKLNSKSVQKALPEHASPEQETIEQQPVIPVKVVEESPETPVVSQKPVIEEEIFKIDKEPSTFEFILNDKPSTDRFEFEEKSVDEIFDRPLSKEEEQIIAQKQKLRELDSLGSELPEDDEIGPEPFLVSEPAPVEAELENTPEEQDIEAHEEPVEEEEEIFEQEEDVISQADAQQDRIEAGVEEVPAAFSAEEPVPAEKHDFIAAATPSESPLSPGTAEQTKTEPIAAPIQDEQPKSRPTLNDILSGNAGKVNNPASTRTPIADLKQAISLNDKMRYIKDLFNGYNLAYAEAIDLLNKMPDFKTADAFLQNNYALKNNWAAKQDTADQFYELLNQRFPAK